MFTIIKWVEPNDNSIHTAITSDRDTTYALASMLNDGKKQFQLIISETRMSKVPAPNYTWVDMEYLLQPEEDFNFSKLSPSK